MQPVRQATDADQVRLFFALWPDERVRERLDSCSSEIHRATGGRRTQARNLHLTLVFLGDVANERVAGLHELASTISFEAGALVLDRPDYWKHNRIAWLGVSDLPDVLRELVAELRGALVQGGYGFDTQPFVPHVTLVRDARAPKQWPALEAVDWPVKGFALVAAGRDEQGPAYRIIGEWPAS
jgi:RNA 2',3'-cyclic 3'-phosphodiesterase